MSSEKMGEAPPSYSAPPQGYAQPMYPQAGSVQAGYQPVYPTAQPAQFPVSGSIPPPPPGYPAGGAQTSTVIINQPSTSCRQGYGPTAIHMSCPYCQANITTSTSKSCGALVCMVFGIICFIGLFFPLLWLGCCLIPFCIPSLYDTRHKCPNCERLLGTHNAGGSM